MYGIPLRYAINKSSTLKENSLKLIWEIMCYKLPKPKGRFKKVILAVTFCIFINNKMEDVKKINNLKEQQKVQVSLSASKYVQILENSDQNTDDKIIINGDNLPNIRCSGVTEILNKKGDPLELDHIDEHSIQLDDEESLIPENVSQKNVKILSTGQSDSTIQKDEFPLDLSFKNKCHEESPHESVSKSRNCSVSPSLGFYLDREKGRSMTPNEFDKCDSRVQPDTSSLTSNELKVASEELYAAVKNEERNSKNKYENTRSTKRNNTETNFSCILEGTQVNDNSKEGLPLNSEPTLVKPYLTTNNFKDEEKNLDITVEGSEIDVRNSEMCREEEYDNLIEENETVSIYSHSKLDHKILTEHINRLKFSNGNCNEQCINVESEEKASEESCEISQNYENSRELFGENDVFINLTIDDSTSHGSNNQGTQVDDVVQNENGRQDLNICEQRVHVKKSDISLECVDTSKLISNYKKNAGKPILSHHSLEKLCAIIQNVQEVKPCEKIENKIYEDDLKRKKEDPAKDNFDETLVGSNTEDQNNQISKEKDCLNSRETNSAKVIMNGEDEMCCTEEVANRLNQITESVPKTQISTSCQGHSPYQEIDCENVALTSGEKNSSAEDSSEFSDNRVSSSTVIVEKNKINGGKEVCKGPVRNTSKTETPLVANEEPTRDVTKSFDFIKTSLSLSSGYEGLQGTVSENSSWLVDEESSTTLQSEHCNSTMPENLSQNVFHPPFDYSLNRFQGLTLNSNFITNESTRQADLNSYPHIFPNFAVPSTSSGFERPGSCSASTGLSPHPLVDSSNSASMHHASSWDNDRQSFSARDSIRFDLGRSCLIPYHHSSFAPPRVYYPCQVSYPAPPPSHHGIHTNTYYPQPSDQYGVPSNTFNFFIDNRPAHSYLVPPNLTQPLFPSAQIQNTPQVADPRTRHSLNIHRRSESQNNSQQRPDDYSINERSTSFNPPSDSNPNMNMPTHLSAKLALQQKIKQNKLLFNPLNELSRSTEKSQQPDSQHTARNISSPEIREILNTFLDAESSRTQPLPQITRPLQNQDSIYNNSSSSSTNMPHSEDNSFLNRNYQEERNGPICLLSSHSSQAEYRSHIEDSLPSQQGEVETISDDSEINDESSRSYSEQEEIDVEDEDEEEDIQYINEPISPKETNPADIIIEAISSDRVYMNCIAALGQYLGFAHPYNEVSTIVKKIILQVRLGKLTGRNYFEIVPMMDLFISLSDRVGSIKTDAEKTMFLKYILPYSMLIFVSLTLNMEYGDKTYRAISLEMIATFLQYASGSPTLSPVLSYILFLCFLAYQPFPTIIESGRMLSDHESYFCLVVKILHDMLFLIPEMCDPYRDMIIELMFEVSESLRTGVLISRFSENFCLILSPFMLLPIYRYYSEAIDEIINYLTRGTYRRY